MSMIAFALSALFQVKRCLLASILLCLHLLKVQGAVEGWLRATRHSRSIHRISGLLSPSLRVIDRFILMSYSHASLLPPSPLPHSNALATAARSSVPMPVGFALRGAMFPASSPNSLHISPQVIGFSPHWAQYQSLRGLFGAPKAKVNLQIHTHEKYKQALPQFTHDWMVGRYILDRNGTIWHKQANSSHKRNAKSASQVTRLKRLKPLYSTFAKKFKKVGFNRKFWIDPRPQDVPGFHGLGPASRVRHNAKPDKRDKIGDRALLPHD
eukprot:gene27015-2241_t